MHDEFIAKSLTKDEEIELSCQIAIRPQHMAKKIDTHCENVNTSFKGKAVPVRVIQYNVQTLKDEGDEIDLYTRFELGKCAIVCLQENRKKYSGIKDMYGYIRCIAAGVHGDHGVEIAISKHCHFAVDDEGNKCFVEREHVSIVCSDPRCILVRVCNAAMDFYISSAHAPFLQSTTDYKKWWDSFSKSIETHCRFGKPVVLGIDANCQMYVTDQYNQWCLKVKGGKQPANFTSMCKCFEKLSIALPAGEVNNHSNLGEYGTYTPTIGNETIIIDHIATIGSIQVMPRSLFSDPSLARACQVDKDHIPISAELLIRVSENDHSHERRRVIKYDMSKIHDSECAAAFRSKLKEFPVVGIEVENSSHCHLIQNFVHEALLECFPMSKVKKKKEYITDSTFECIKEGRALCKSLYRMSRQLASFVLRALFAEWKKYKSDTHSSFVEDADGIDGTIFLVLYLHDRVS